MTNLLIILIILILFYKINYDTNHINYIYNKNFYFNKFKYNYYDMFSKIMITPRSCIQYLKIFDNFRISNNDVVLDIGSGDGLNLLYFNYYHNFKEIIGVEIDQTIYEISKKNIFLSESKKIKLINNNILNYEIPYNVNYIYLFNPFQKNYLFNSYDEEKRNYDVLIKNILKSYNNNQRKITIIFMNIENEILNFFKKYFSSVNVNKTYYLFLKVQYAIFTIY